MRFSSFKIFILSILLITTVIYAEQNVNLYEGESMVSNYSTPIREQAYPEILKQVLVKISGNDKTIDLPSIQKNLSNAQNLVESYSYFENIENGQKQLFLKVKFVPQMVQQLLKTKVPQNWLNKRPTVLVWIVTEDEFGQPLLVNNNSSEIANKLDSTSSKLGLPLILPNANLTDSTTIQPQDIINLDQEAIQNASQSYSTQVILVGHIWQNFINSWRSKWVLLNNNQQVANWEIEESNQDQLLTKVMQKVVNTLNQPIATDATTEITLTIKDVNDLKTYASIVKYLHTLDFVEKITTLKVETNYASFILKTNSNVTQLIKILKSQNQLIINDDENTIDNNADGMVELIAHANNAHE